jgi:hypothetical protein
MSSLRIAAITAALAATLVTARPVPATQIEHLDTRALVSQSSDIVVGTVEGARSYWNDRHTKILTEVTLRVSDRLKGAAAERVTLTQLGGELDGLRYEIEGSPQFKSGQEALLFLWRDARGRAQVNGLAQGKFDIHRDPATGERLLERAMPGLAVRDARSLSLVRAGERPARITLDDMMREIRSALEEAGR